MEPKDKMKNIDKLKNKHKIFNTKQALKLGISKQLLHYYLKKGIIEKISHGIYKFSSDTQFDLLSNLREIQFMIPQGIFGYKTALKIYDLTDELSSEIDLIVPKTNCPKRKLEGIKLHRCRTNLKTGVIKYKGLHITNLERTIIDLLKTGEPISFLIEILKTASSRKMTYKIPLLKKYGTLFRAKRKAELLIEAL